MLKRYVLSLLAIIMLLFFCFLTTQGREEGGAVVAVTGETPRFSHPPQRPSDRKNVRFCVLRIYFIDFYIYFPHFFMLYGDTQHF